MWNNVNFSSCSDAFFQYKFDDDMFFIKCELYSPILTGGKVSVHSDNSICELGSLKYDGTLLVLDRTYPVSFLLSNGIDKEAITHFSIETSDGNVFLSYPLSGHDVVLDNAQKLLNEMKGLAKKEDAKKFSDQTRERIKKLKITTLPFLPEFEWHIVEDEKESFLSSAIRHIVMAPQFLLSFEKTGFWIIGFKQDDDIFAVCIKGEPHLPNPMENAMDCCVSFEEADKKYYVVGIGFFDDGQYFVRL